MPQNRTDAPLCDAVDPGSDRLGADAVIAIHRAHLAGQSWAAIAATHDTNRRHIARIVQGRRWAGLHPTQRPDLYETPDAPEATHFTEQQIERAWNAAREAHLRS